LDPHLEQTKEADVRTVGIDEEFTDSVGGMFTWRPSEAQRE